MARWKPKGRVAVTLEPAGIHLNQWGTVHTDLTATLLDSCMDLAIQSMLEIGLGSTTLEFKISLVRAITLERGHISAGGKVLNCRSRLGITESRFTGTKGRLLAHGTTRSLIFQSSCVVCAFRDAGKGQFHWSRYCSRPEKTRSGLVDEIETIVCSGWNSERSSAGFLSLNISASGPLRRFNLRQCFSGLGIDRIRDTSLKPQGLPRELPAPAEDAAASISTPFCISFLGVAKLRKLWLSVTARQSGRIGAPQWRASCCFGPDRHSGDGPAGNKLSPQRQPPRRGATGHFCFAIGPMRQPVPERL
jgi:uncharacterized protein (TIGR00369 family)